jgi:hypothetical protein
MSSRQIHLIQRSEDWIKERLYRIGGSEIGKLVGLSSFESPLKAIEEKLAAIERHESEKLDKFVPSSVSPSFSSSSSSSSSTTSTTSTTPTTQPYETVENARKQMFLDHGINYEMSSFVEFLKWFTEHHKSQVQQYTIPPLYHVPLPKTNPYFSLSNDEERFGVSLDVEASKIDVEIKNPFDYFSFIKNYSNTINPAYFAQVQYAMAIRNRTQMYFMATSFEDETGVFLGMVIWHVKFDETFFKERLYRPARLVSQMIEEKEATISLEWVNEKKRYEQSEEWQSLFKRTCRRVYFWTNREEIEQRKAQRTSSSARSTAVVVDDD